MTTFGVVIYAARIWYSTIAEEWMPFVIVACSTAREATVDFVPSASDGWISFVMLFGIQHGGCNRWVDAVTQRSQDNPNHHFEDEEKKQKQLKQAQQEKAATKDAKQAKKRYVDQSQPKENRDACRRKQMII